MIKANGLHHLAIATGDIKRQIEFFTDVLGTELVALYWMHGLEGAWHGFVKLSDNASIAFVQTKGTPAIEPVFGVSHAGNPGADCAPGTMQHLALNVDTETDLLTMRDRIRSRGIPVFGPIDHGFCQSIYFAGPENLALEISTSTAPIDPRAWIDPEVVELAGISAEELARFKAPAAFTGQGGKQPQPAYDPDKPHLRHPEAKYRRMLATHDDEYSRARNYPDPPVKV
ncbi:MAG: VOC family protein [Burkholderiaceae bacterium]